MTLNLLTPDRAAAVPAIGILCPGAVLRALLTSARLRAVPALGLAIVLACAASTAGAADTRSAEQRRADARSCARLGTIGAGTVTCMQLLPRVLEERERRINGS